MTKQQIWEWLTNHSKQLMDFLLFLLLVSMGAFVKIIKQVRQGAKASWKWFLAEAIVSFLLLSWCMASLTSSCTLANFLLMWFVLGAVHFQPFSIKEWKIY